MAFTQITVTGTYADETGGDATGTVLFTLTETISQPGGTTVAPVQITAPLVNGQIQSPDGGALTLAATNDPATAPTGAAYLVQEQIGDAETNSYFAVIPYDAAGGTIDVTQLTKVQPASITAMYLLASLLGVAGGVAELDSGGNVPASELGNVAGSLLGRAQYAPGSIATYTIASTTLAAIDATNLTVGFVVPPSGTVMVSLEGLVQSSANGDAVVWALFVHGTTTQKGPAAVVDTSLNYRTIRQSFLLTGLTPGATDQLDWAWAVGAGTGTLKAGNPVSPWSTIGAPATMEVRAA